MTSALLLSAVLAAAPARAADPKTDIAAPTAQGSSVGTNENMSEAEASQKLQSHHIRETHRVTIGSTDPNAGGAGDGLKPKADAGMQASASAGAPGAGGGTAARSLAGKVQDGPIGENLNDGALNDKAKVMLGGTPTDFRSDKAKAVAAVGQAANAWTLGDFKTVISQTNQALAVDPRNHDALAMQALAYEHEKDYADSEADLRRAVDVDSADVKTWEHLAWAAYKQGKAQDALGAAKAALALDSNDAAALALKSYAEDALGDRAQASADIKAAAGIDRSFASRAARADSGDRLCGLEEELTDQPGARRGGKSGGLPSWAPWIGGAMLVGLGLMMALISQLKAQPPQS